MTVSLAFLAPDIVKAAVEGRLPRGYGLKRLIDLPLAWPDQWRTLGLETPRAGVRNAPPMLGGFCSSGQLMPPSAPRPAPGNLAHL